MTIKNTADGDAVTTETMADRLRAVQSEPWRKMRYTDENDETAWEVYNESLFLRDPNAPEKPPPKEGEEEKPDLGEDLEDTMPHFSTKWGDKELLEAVSGIQKEQPQPEPEPWRVLRLAAASHWTWNTLLSWRRSHQRRVA